MGLIVPLSGLARLGSLFFLPLINSARPGSLPFLHSFSRVGSMLLATDFTMVGMSSLLHSFGCIDFSSSMPGLSKPGPSLLVPDPSHMTFMLPSRSSV